MAQEQLKLTVALKDGVITKVEDVQSGIKCGCVCPACGEPLVAKKGVKRMHHFAHSTGHNCEYGYESSLHLACKEILSKAKKITIPPVYVTFPDTNKKDELVCSAKEIEIEKVELEQRFRDIIPDVVVYSGKKKFFIEIYVTHSIDKNKLQKLKEANISTIEIDLSKERTTITVSELSDLLLCNNERKKWKYNADANKWFHKFCSVADERKIIKRGLALHIYCPIKSQIWPDNPYENFCDECSHCKYCISFNEDHILCSWRRQVSTVDDLIKLAKNQI